MKGKGILRVRLGHEANCSSGMVVMATFLASGLVLLPLTVITGVCQAIDLKADAPKSKRAFLYWLLPLIPGLVVMAFLLRLASNYVLGPDLAALILGPVTFYALAIWIGYHYAPRFKRTGFRVLIVPGIFVLGWAALILALRVIY